MKKANIVFVNSSRSWGGTENWSVTTAGLLRRKGHRVVFVCSSDFVRDRAQKAGLPTRRVVMRNDGDVWAFFRFHRLFKKFRTAILVTTKWREYLLASVAGRVAGVPVVVMRLGLRVKPKNDLKRRLIFRTVDRILVNSKAIEESLLARPWIDARKVAVIYNGVDLRDFAPSRWTGSFREELGVDSGVPLVGTVGSLTPQKGHQFLLETIPLVLREVPQARFVVVGEGFLKPQLEARVEALGLGENVTFAGFRSDIPAVLRSLDFLVVPSSNDGLAWVLLEAMAMKKAVVATDVSGADEAVFHGETGLVVAYGNREQLAEAILALIKNRRMRKRMGEKARELVEERFSQERMLSETESLLMDGLSCG